MKKSEGLTPLILIADDTPANIKILTGTLRENYRIGFATNGEKAIAFARENKPDLILLDIMMPDMDGYEVCSCLKADEKTNDIPVIFITVLSDVEDKTRGFKAGAVDYITKPFDEAEVRARVRIHLELKQYRDHLEEVVGARTLELVKAKTKLEEKTVFLEEANTALKVLLRNRDNHRVELEENILQNVGKLVIPWLEKARNTVSAKDKKKYLNILETNLNDIISPFAEKLSHRFLNFTPSEIQVANLIKQDKSTKEIAELLNLSTHTIDSHRKHIREKMGISNQRANLKTHLLAIEE